MDPVKFSLRNIRKNLLIRHTTCKSFRFVSLTELKAGLLIQDDGQTYYGQIKLIKLIAQCMKVLKLDFPIRVACNLYATGMTTTADSDPLDQAYCDFETFYIAGKDPSLDFVSTVHP
jgi:hypothetical protein